MIQRIEAQGKLWILDINNPWDGVGYSDATTVYCCELGSDEQENFENLFVELTNKNLDLDHEHTTNS